MSVRNTVTSTSSARRARPDAREDPVFAGSPGGRIGPDRGRSGIGRGAAAHRLWHGTGWMAACPTAATLQMAALGESGGALVRDLSDDFTVMVWLPIRWPRSLLMTSR